MKDRKGVKCMPKTPSPLEVRFARLWDVLGGSPLAREYKFHPVRRWKADFASLPARTLIEIEGGIWHGGRHVSPRGFIADAEKYLCAALAGWSVLRLTEAQLTEDTIKKIIRYVNERTVACDMARGVATA